MLWMAAGLLFLMPAIAPYSYAQSVAGCAVFPANNIWNTPVDQLPVDANSGNYVAAIGTSAHGHADFGSGLWDGAPIGIPFVSVPGTQAKVAVTFDYSDESDPGPYPIPGNAPIEGGPSSAGDRHALVIDQDHCVLFELYSAYPQGNGGWHAGSGAIFDLKSNGLRPAGWTSADAAGLPIFPGLVRYDEVAAGAILHAVRFTAPQTRNAYVWPGRHEASSLTSASYPPMGQRFRLKAGFDISGFAPQVQVILRALKKYGTILADNGSPWYFSGAPDDRWNNDTLHQLAQLQGSDFEAVNESSLMVSADSAAVRTGAAPVIASVVNGGSGVSGPVAPGEILTIMGSGFGSDAQVIFDGRKAPLLYVGAAQINTAAPYEIGGQSTTTMQVSSGGAVTAGRTMPVAESAPGIFASVDQNYKRNSAANPVKAGAVLILFATGEGQTNPPGVDGQVASQVLAKPILPVSVTIGGKSTAVLYAGSAPGLIAGVMQINLRVPAGVPSGVSVPLALHIGSASTSVKIAIR